MEVHDDGLVPVELKYCERCGALRFRSSGEEEVYCPSCVPKMAEFPEPKRKRVLVVEVNSVEELEGCLAELSAFTRKPGTHENRHDCSTGSTSRFNGMERAVAMG